MMDWLPHQNNLDHKIDTNYKQRRIKLQRFKADKYVPYHTQQMLITDISKQATRQKTDLLAGYLRSIEKFNADGWITAQSKFRSTVLEEFCGYLFKDLPKLQELGLGFYGKHIFAGIGINSSGGPRFQTKDVDFCISKAVRINIENTIQEIRLPLIAIECKTYVDKTMFNEAQFTAQKLKGGAPRIRVLMLTETNAIGINEIPSQTPIDQIYVLRREKAAPIGHSAVWDFFCDVRDTLERIGTEERLILPGKLLVS